MRKIKVKKKKFRSFTPQPITFIKAWEKKMKKRRDSGSHIVLKERKISKLSPPEIEYDFFKQGTEKNKEI